MNDELLAQVRALAPWHMNITLDAELDTVDANPVIGPDDHPLPLIRPAELRPLLRRLYPQGLGGKRFIDCACNVGGYSLLASELGAYSFGFDVRDHWIEQARFLKRHFAKSDDQVRFEVCDLLEVDRRLGDERFDICLFKGIFYHLPDPVAALKLVADRTDEVLILDTAATSGLDDGFLKLVSEGVANPMSGVHGLGWRPTGPEVLATILRWLGFTAVRTCYFKQHPPTVTTPARIRIVGARDAALLADLATPVAPTLYTPHAGDVLTGRVALNAHRADDVLDPARVEFHLSGAEIGTHFVVDATRTNFGWMHDWDTTTIANGDYTLHATMFDMSGTASPRAGVAVSVRN